MKNYILNTKLIYYASRLNEKDAHAALLGAQYKKSGSPNKSSKIDLQYEKVTDSINLYMKPRCYVNNYIYDKNAIYVGVLDTDWTIKESDYDYIKKICEKHNIIPIFNGPGDFSQLITDILDANTFTYTHSKLNHAELYDLYCKFNNQVLKELGGVKDTDIVWAQDYNFIHTLAHFKNTILTISRFNELWKCIPFYNLLLDDILKVKILDFCCKNEIKDFKTFVSYTYFTEKHDNPELVSIDKGIDKDFIDRTFPKDIHIEKNTIVIPYDSLHHLICIDKYINKYDVPLQVNLLNINNKKVSQDVLNYVNYLQLKIEVKVCTPKSNEDFLKILSRCHIGFYKSLENYFSYFNRHVVASSVYDYESVADEIYKKLHFVEKNNECVPDLKDYVTELFSKIQSRSEVEYKNKTVDFSNISNLSTPRIKRQIIFDKNSDKEPSDSTTSQFINTILYKDLPLEDVCAIILDYDGTLVPVCDDPKDAILPDSHKEILLNLNKKIKVVISSGRSREDMDRFVPSNLEVFSEHCTFVRINNEWRRLLPKINFDLEYRIARFYEERTPGSFIEKKSNGFVFHYRSCEPSLGFSQAQKLYTDLIKISPHIKLGKKIVEYKVGNKNDIFKYYRKNLIICGDDVTDEDMFDNSRGLTIRVGYCEKTNADYYVNDVDEMIHLLQQLATSK